jgi:uncharacterized protein DUF6152
MKLPTRGLLLVLALVCLAGMTAFAHHSVAAKFDESKTQTLSGIVTLVDWRNPHVHVFLNVRGSKGEWVNWAIELESPIDLHESGWTVDSVQPGAAITVVGYPARNGSRQLWSNKMTLTQGGKQVLNYTPKAPPPLTKRPTPSVNGVPRLGMVPGGGDGYWAFPSSTVLVESTAKVDIRPDGLLRNPAADAAKVAPMQPWALALYKNRQTRFLQDDPTFLNCKPPGGPRQFQQRYGVQFVEDTERQRIFVLIGSGNRNYRIIYLDGRSHVGQVGGDDDNPLYYGRAVGKWNGQTLEVDTRGFNEDFWFTNGGLPHTDQLKLLEKFTRTDFDTLRYDVTVDDPGAYTRPWSTSWTLRWVGGAELPAHFCQDNRP